MDSQYIQQLKCTKCGRKFSYVKQKVHYCSCGNKIVIPTTTVVKPRLRLDTIKKPEANPRAVAKIKVCTSCPNGFYDAVQDRCLEIIRIGLKKNPPQQRAGIVTPYLLAHPEISCPLGHHDEIDKEHNR